MPHAAEWGVHGFSMVFQNRVLDQSMEKWGWNKFAEKRGTLHIFFGPALHRLRFFTIFLSMKIEQVESSEKKSHPNSKMRWLGHVSKSATGKLIRFQMNP